MWEDIEFDPEKIPAFKLGFHIAQIIFAFVLWCLEIAVFRNDGARIVGNNGWTFAVVRIVPFVVPRRGDPRVTVTDFGIVFQFFLSIPAWIYLAMAPRFPRTRKIAEPHAMLVVDALFTIIWLSAFATQAAYNTANLCGTACGISKAIVGLGFFVLYVLRTLLYSLAIHINQINKPLCILCTDHMSPQPLLRRNHFLQHLDPEVLPMEQPPTGLRPHEARLVAKYRPG